MSTAMIMRPYSAPPAAARHEGLGDLTSDITNAVFSGVDARIESAKTEVLNEVARQGRQAKIYAVAGGFAAGLLGAFLYGRFIKR